MPIDDAWFTKALEICEKTPRQFYTYIMADRWSLHKEVYDILVTRASMLSETLAEIEHLGGEIKELEESRGPPFDFP